MCKVAAKMYKHSVLVPYAMVDTLEVDLHAASIAAKQQSEQLVKQATRGSGFDHSSYSWFQSNFSCGHGYSRFSGRLFVIWFLALFRACYYS